LLPHRFRDIVLVASEMQSTTDDGDRFDQLLKEAVQQPDILVPRTTLLSGRFVIQHLLFNGL